MRYFLTVVTLAMTLLVTLRSTAEAAEYFVAPAPVGNNGHTGTMDQPFATIQHGVDALRPGDVLNIREGRYVEQVTIRNGGTANNPVTIQAYEDENVVIDGEYRLPAGGKPNSPTQKALERGLLRTAADGNYVFLGDGPGNGSTVYDSSAAQLVDITDDYVIFKNIDITQSRGRGLRTYNGIDLREDDEYGAQKPITGVVIDGVKISKTRWHGFTEYGIGNTIKNCEISESNTFAQFSRSAGELNWGSAIAQSIHKNLTVDNCIVHDNWGEGIIAYTNTLIQNSQFYNNYSVSVYLERSSGSTVRNNLIFNTGETLRRWGEPYLGLNITNEHNGSPGAGDSSNNQVYNNIFVGGKKNVVSFQGSGTLSDIDMYNNTLINATESNVQFGNATYINYRFRNNIIYNLSSDVLLKATNAPEYASNIWNKNPGTGVVVNGSQVVDPKLVNPDAVISILRAAEAINPANYGPQSGSPVIGAATGETPERDFFGCKRDSQPDIGAIEFGGTDCDREATPLPTSEPTSAPTVDPAGNGWEGVLVWLRNWGGDLKARLVN